MATMADDGLEAASGPWSPTDDGNLSLGRRIGVLVVLAALGGAIILAAGGVGGSLPVAPVVSPTPSPSATPVASTFLPLASPPTGVPTITPPKTPLVNSRTDRPSG